MLSLSPDFQVCPNSTHTTCCFSGVSGIILETFENLLILNLNFNFERTCSDHSERGVHYTYISLPVKALFRASFLEFKEGYKEGGGDEDGRIGAYDETHNKEK